MNLALKRQFELSSGRKSQEPLLSRAGGQVQPEPDPMLPAAVQFLVAMVACSLNERMARTIEYLLPSDSATQPPASVPDRHQKTPFGPNFDWS